MKLFLLHVVTAVTSISVVEAVEQTPGRLRIHDDTTCTITNESQCDGQCWTGSTCCADPGYECRWSDVERNMKRCQKIMGMADTNPFAWDDVDLASDDDNSDRDDYSSYDVTYTSFVDDWDDCTRIDVGCSNSSSICIGHSVYYAQCKPETLPTGELCGQDDGINVWFYDFCPRGESCEASGTDYRCTRLRHNQTD